MVYVREALTTFFDPYSQIANNIYQFVAETRMALATPRPGAICLVGGLLMALVEIPQVCSPKFPT